MSTTKKRRLRNKSWKTSSWGALTAAGMGMLEAGRELDWLTPREKHIFMLVGLICTIAGPLLLGLSARDNDKSDQSVGLRPELPLTNISSSAASVPVESLNPQSSKTENHEDPKTST